ncbi:hypothetical protein AY599_09650 [Leptolyngbya valderiana BDU 20041]|nr:hypothetical protein AY599_09650 [Leptolyngbya valderiana BDU 20041]
MLRSINFSLKKTVREERSLVVSAEIKEQFLENFDVMPQKKVCIYLTPLKRKLKKGGKIRRKNFRRFLKKPLKKFDKDLSSITVPSKS